MIVVMAVMADVIAIVFGCWVYANHRRRKRLAAEYQQGLAETLVTAGLTRSEPDPDARGTGLPPIPKDADVPTPVAAMEEEVSSWPRLGADGWETAADTVAESTRDAWDDLAASIASTFAGALSSGLDDNPPTCESIDDDAPTGDATRYEAPACDVTRYERDEEPYVPVHATDPLAWEPDAQSEPEPRVWKQAMSAVIEAPAEAGTSPVELATSPVELAERSRRHTPSRPLMPTPPTTPFPTPEPRPAAARGFALDDSPGSWVARQVLGVAEANMTASPVPAEPRAEPVSIRTPPAERFGPPRDRLDVVEREPAAGVTA